MKIRSTKSNSFSFLVNPIILFMGFIPLGLVGGFELVGIPLAKYLLLMIIGAILCADEEILETIKRYRGWYLAIMLLTIVNYLIRKLGIINTQGILDGYIKEVRAWSTMLTIIGYAMVYWNGTNKLINYFRGACFPIYEVHQTILVVIAYFIIQHSTWFGIQYLGILILTFVLSILVYELLKKFRVTRWMFGIKA